MYAYGSVTTIDNVHRITVVIIALFLFKGVEWGLTTRIYLSTAIAPRLNVQMNILTPWTHGINLHRADPKYQFLKTFVIGVIGSDSKQTTISLAARFMMKIFCTLWKHIFNISLIIYITWRDLFFKVTWITEMFPASPIMNMREYQAANEI